MEYTFSIEDKQQYRNMSGKYLLTGAQCYNNPSLVKGVSKAVVEGNLPNVKELVAAGEDINALDEYGNSPIFIAAVKNNLPILRYLLSVDDSRINYHNFLGETPLLRAMKDHKYEVAEELLHNGAFVNTADNSKVTPLHLGVNNTRITQLLINAGAIIDVVDKDEQTPLFCAVDCNNLETVCLLLYHNADVTISNKHNYTPFMLAIERGYDEIQGALFEYIDDYEDVIAIHCNFSTLGLAILYDSPFTEEMILRGADVNNVSRHTNGPLILIVQCARTWNNVNMNVIKLIWERMDYEPTRFRSLLGTISEIPNSQFFHKIIDIFINSDKFSVIAESLCLSDDFYSFVLKSIEYDLPLEKLTQVFCLLLCEGYIPKEHDIITIFNNWGYCEIIKISLHVNIRRSLPSATLGYIPIRLLYEVKCDVNQIIYEFVGTIRKRRYLTVTLIMIVLQLLDFCVYPPLLEEYQKLRKDDCVSMKMRALPKVPSLLELARNQTREHIKKSYQVKTSCELYTLINNLDIADYYKKILNFEVVIYRPKFNENDFRRYIRMLEEIQVRKQIKDNLVRSAIRYAIVKY